MKKFFVTMFAAFAMFAMVSCGGNAGIDAGEEFLANPSKENYDKLLKESSSLKGSDAAEYAQWYAKNTQAIATACQKLGIQIANDAVEDAQDALTK